MELEQFYIKKARLYQEQYPNATPEMAFLEGIKCALERNNEENSPNVYDDSELGFDRVWDMYQKKVGPKDRLRKKWNKLSQKERRAAIAYIPRYVEATPDKKYRKNFETFLNQKSWHDEIITDERHSTNDLTEKAARILNIE